MKHQKKGNYELKQKMDELGERPSPHSQKIQARQESSYQTKISHQKQYIIELEITNDKLKTKLTKEKKKSVGT